LVSLHKLGVSTSGNLVSPLHVDLNSVYCTAR